MCLELLALVNKDVIQYQKFRYIFLFKLCVYLWACMRVHACVYVWFYSKSSLVETLLI